MPVEWSKVRLNVNSAADMKKALKALADVKKVYALEARMLGLAPMLNEEGEMPGEEELVEVPAWRYAMINYPHPLLSNGLSILDTPGLNALGMEPELTVSTIPTAHAILFLLSIDTGVTKSDLEIWDRYVRPGLPQKIAVLNKVDLMWDELKTNEEIERAIERMAQTTAEHLHLPRERIFAISAQKGLLGRIRDDAALIRRSGIDQLERFLAEEIVPMKRQILCKAVVTEIGGMMNSSRASVAKRQQANQAEIAELNGLVGKSREVVTRLWQKITEEKNAYNAALAEYKVNSNQFNVKRSALMDALNAQRLDEALAKSSQAIQDSWTTITLQRGMNSLVKDMSEDFEKVFAASEDIKKLMQGVYDTFITKFGFQKMTIPSLDLDPQRTKLQLLVHQTEAFVKDPVNVFGKEKHFVVKNFYATLVKPLEVQIKDHKAQLQSRLDNLAKINEKTGTINEQMAKVKAAEASLAKQRELIEGLIQRVSEHDAKSSLSDSGAIPPRDPTESEDWMRTTKFNVADLQAATAEAQRMHEAKKAAAAAPKPAPAAPAAPLVSDDLMSQIGGIQQGASAAGPAAAQPAAPAPAFDPMRTQKLPPGAADTQKLPPNAGDTQKLTVDPTTTQRLPDPATTQKLPTDTQRLSNNDTMRLTPLADRTKTIKLPEK
jgi:hypothetical protein